MTIQHIYQPEKSRICGQCSVAMVTGKPIEEVFQVFGHKHGTHTHEVVSALRKLGVQTSNQRTAFPMNQIPELCIMHISRKKVRHWAVHHKGTIYCSSLGVFTLAEYQAREGVRMFSCIKIQLP